MKEDLFQATAESVASDGAVIALEERVAKAICDEYEGLQYHAGILGDEWRRFIPAARAAILAAGQGER